MNHVFSKCICFFMFISLMPAVVQDLGHASNVHTQDRPVATMARGKEPSCSKDSTMAW